MKQLTLKLLNTLIEAKNHLEYCSYGDKWERECAIEFKLPEKIDKVINEAKKELGIKD